MGTISPTVPEQDKTPAFSHFYPRQECPHYGAVVAPFARKCYYEPQCWRGELDDVIEMLGVAR